MVREKAITFPLLKDALRMFQRDVQHKVSLLVGDIHEGNPLSHF
jgi:hypothetical protein